MKNKNIRLLCIVLTLLVPVILLGGLTGCFLINAADYIQITENDEGTDIINYDGNIYNLYTRGGHFYSTESNETIFCLRPEATGKKIGYTRKPVLQAHDVLLLYGASDNIIITTEHYANECIWLKEGFSLPNIFDAELDKIEFSKTHTDDRNLLLEKNVGSIKDILEMQIFFRSNDEIEETGSVYFRSAEIISLEIVMGLCIVNSNYYLKYIDSENNNLYYLLNDDFKNLLIQTMYA